MPFLPVFAAASLALIILAAPAPAQSPVPNRPDPREIPVPPIRTSLGTLPGVDELPERKELPGVLPFEGGARVTTQRQWRKRREEMKRILSYYAIGLMPPAPGNVRGQEVQAETVLDGQVRYRLVRLTFGPARKLALDIGIFTPAGAGPFPAIILMGGTPPGATPLPRLPQGPNQGRGEDVLLLVGPAPPATLPVPAPPANAQATATRHADVFRRGYALVIYNPNDCAEDTTLRNPDGSWAFRNTRFYPAYPGYDWGILAGWAWGASRVADYLATDRSIDKSKLIVTGASRNGKAAMIAAAFDERLMGAPVVTGGGMGAYRFAGPRRSETLDVMQRKYPNWFSPNLHQFWGQREKLPFDQHWFLALAAPRPFIALEGITDTISLPEAVRQSILGAQPAYEIFGARNRLGANYARHGHAFTGEDWTALMDFFDLHLRGRKTERSFESFPSEQELDAALARGRAWDALRSRVKDEKYLNHSRAVEAIMRAYAAAGVGDADEWGLAGLLHDIDLPATAKDLSRHGVAGAQIVRELGLGEAVAHAVLSHDDRPGVARSSRLDHALYCADQVFWLLPSPLPDSAAPEALWQRAQALPNKRDALPGIAVACAAIGLEPPRAIEAALGAMRNLSASAP